MPFIPELPAGTARKSRSTAKGSNITVTEESEVTDHTAMSRRQRQRYGVKDNEHTIWVRDPRYWNGVGGASDRIEEVMESVDAAGYEGGARVVLDPKYDNKWLTRGQDLVCMAIPKEMKEKRDKELLDELKRQKRMKETTETEEGQFIDRLRMGPKRSEITEDYLDRISQENHMTGIIGPTKHLSLADTFAGRQFSKEYLENEQRRWRSQGRRDDEQQDKVWQGIYSQSGARTIPETSVRGEREKKVSMTGVEGIGKSTRETVRDRLMRKGKEA